MQSFTRRCLLGGLTIAAGTGMFATTALAQLQAEVYVPMAPPPPRVEVVPVLPPERIEIEHWQPGYWRWNGHAHEWAEGHYVERPRRGAVWIPGRWEQHPQGWVFIQGHWG
jgi:hypothetical protein